MTPTDMNRVNVAVMKAWSQGFEAAIRTLRELEDEFEDETMKAAAHIFADILEASKP